MTQPGVRERSRAETRQRLLEAGMALFAERGVQGAKACEVAVRAGVAVGTLYLHFGDKDGLARAVMQHAIDELLGRLQAVRTRVGGDPAERARAHAETVVRFAEERRPLARVLFVGDVASTRLGAEMLDRLATHQEKRIRDGMMEGWFRDDVDPGVAAQALIGMQARVIGWWTEDPTRAPRETVVDTLAKLRLSGIHPD